MQTIRFKPLGRILRIMSIILTLFHFIPIQILYNTRFNYIKSLVKEVAIKK